MENSFNPVFKRELTEDLCDGWSFSFDGKTFRDVRVPFCPESELSGIGYKGFIRECFYKKTFTVKDNRLRAVLHFGAVDNEAIVYVNGHYVGSHKGGFTPFSFDVSDFITVGENTLELTVHDLNVGFFGKQSYKEKSFGCFYTRTTGIWQPVWLEYRPENYIKQIKFFPDIHIPSVGAELTVEGKGEYEITVSFDGKKVGGASGRIDYKTRVNIPLSEKHLWDLGRGDLYEVSISFGCDRVTSYFGLREVRYEGYRFLLNDREVFQKLVLDQGFYPDGIYTAKSVEEMQRDIDISLRLGFNGARLHQKVFDPRFLYLCDKAGYIVWGEFPSWGGDYSSMSCVGQFLSEWEECMARDFNHPSIVTWCPLNEVWGAWEDPLKKRDVRVVETIYDFTKSYDNTRPAVDASGGHHGERTDLFDFHCYETCDKLREYLDRLENGGVLNVPLLYPSGEEITYRGGMPVNISECGGIAFGGFAKEGWTYTVNEGAVTAESEWGYGKGETDGKAFVERYRQLVELLFKYKKLSGFCYTQLYDVEQERNGFYRYDRSDKLTDEEKEEIRKINAKR